MRKSRPTAHKLVDQYELYSTASPAAYTFSFVHRWYLAMIKHWTQMWYGRKINHKFALFVCVCVWGHWLASVLLFPPWSARALRILEATAARSQGVNKPFPRIAVRAALLLWLSHFPLLWASSPFPLKIEERKEKSRSKNLKWNNTEYEVWKMPKEWWCRVGPGATPSEDKWAKSIRIQKSPPLDPTSLLM